MRRMKDFLESFIVEFDWKDITIFKLCLTAFGIMIGISLPRKNKKAILAASGAVFVVSTILLLCGLFGVTCPFCQEEEDFDFDDDDDEESGLVMKISAAEE
ncbi:permease of phosphate ABC transporter [Anaerotignum sp.]|uniref:permease of phosphate ABC transporter n=1 Tax=Anaerotignum sp. TaxID=2039241 RepID=UPI0028976CBB|nr:permease of phosphate ABC transporter [Anaerotignum sp.]